MSQSFGEIVKRRRQELGLRLTFVAGKVGTNKGYVSGIENGRVNPPAPAFVRKFCTVLHLPFEAMLSIAHAQKAPKAVRTWFVDLVDQKYSDAIAASKPVPTEKNTAPAMSAAGNS